MKPRIIVADDHPMVRQGLCSLIATTSDMLVAAEASDGVEAEHLVRTVPADLMILDIAMPQRGGLHVLELLRAESVELPVLVFTMASANQYAAHVQCIGAQGFIGKDASSVELLRAMRKILAWGSHFPELLKGEQGQPVATHADVKLSAREKQVLSGLLRGDMLVAIAAALGISAASANTYRRRLLEKLGVRNNAELIQLIAKTRL